MPTLYPGAIDPVPDAPPGNVPLGASAPKHTAVHQKLADLLNAIQAELGTEPKGAYASVAARLTAIAAGIITDHGSLTGLADDDHTQYSRKDRQAYNIHDYLDPLGWVKDSPTLPQPLSNFFASLAAAQAVFPNAAALTDEVAGVAIQHCINLTQPASTFRGGKVYVPPGSYRVNTPINLTGTSGVNVEGDSACWSNYTNIYGGWPNKRMPGSSRLLFVGTGSLITYTSQDPVTGVPNNNLRIAHLVLNTDNQTEDLVSVGGGGGSGIFFDHCYFGGGNKQLNYVSGTPFDYYFNKCFFGPSLNDTYPNYCVYIDSSVQAFGGQSTSFNQCTMRGVQISHVCSLGASVLKFYSCTMETCLTGPSIYALTPSNSQAITCVNVHWEGIFTQAYWNGTFFQKSSVDTAKAAIIEYGTAGGTGAGYLTLRDCELNPVVASNGRQLYSAVARAAVRTYVQNCTMSAGLERAFVLRYDNATITYIGHIANTFNPTDGDFLASGEDSLRKAQIFTDIVGFPLSPAMWANLPTTYANRLGNWAPQLMTGMHALAEWELGSRGVTAAVPVKRELFLKNANWLGSSTLDNIHKNYARGDVFWLRSWMTTDAGNHGYNTRIGVLCGKDATSASNTADSWFPLVTGPGMGADRGNASITWNYRDATEQRFATPLTAERRVTIALWYDEPNGARLRVIREATATGAFDLEVYSQKAAATIVRLRAGQYADIFYDGATWRLEATGPVDLSTTAEFEWRRPMKWTTATDPGAPAANETRIGAGKVYTYTAYYVGADQVIGARQAVGAALTSRTAGATYGTTEQTMLQEAHDRIRTLETALRTHGLLKD